MVRGPLLKVWEASASHTFRASAALSDQIAHSGDVDRVAGVCEAAEMPRIFNRAQHRVVVQQNHRCPTLIDACAWVSYLCDASSSFLVAAASRRKVRIV